MNLEDRKREFREMIYGDLSAVLPEEDKRRICERF